MPSPRAVLIGPPGSGKSAVAASLAKAWKVSVRDTDHDVEVAAGRDIPSIFVDDGEEEFRRLEREAVSEALSRHGGVLALGGGAILDPQTQLDLAVYAKAGGAVVYLTVSAATAAMRVGMNQARPLLVGNTRAKWAQLLEGRREIYERLATMTVPTDDMSPTKIVARITEALGT